MKKSKRKLIGFQPIIFDSNQNIDMPKDLYSFEVFEYKALKRYLKHYPGDKDKLFLLPVFDDTIEEPTIWTD